MIKTENQYPLTRAALSLCGCAKSHFLSVLLVTALVAPGTLAHADTSAGKIVVSGDEWAFSDAGFAGNSTYVSNVVNWFGLTPNVAGKKVLILDGQSGNGGFNGTYGAFGNAFRSFLTGSGVIVTYVGSTGGPVSLAGYDAVFVDGLIGNAATLPADLANFVVGGGSVYLAGGTGTPGGGAAGEASYWQPFFTGATGVSDFGLGADGWFEEQGAIHISGPVGNGVTALDWYMGQDVRVGTSPNASAAIWDSAHTLVATWSVPGRLSLIREDSNVILSWAGSHVLQTSTNAVGPYEDILSATSSFTNSINPTGSAFFRLR